MLWKSTSPTSTVDDCCRIAAAIVGALLKELCCSPCSASRRRSRKGQWTARRAIEADALRPETALRKAPDGTTEDVPAADLGIDDVVVLRPGARVPADGVNRRWSGSLDESTITGESMPVRKESGQQFSRPRLNLTAS